MPSSAKFEVNWLGAKAAAERLGIGRRALETLVRDGTITVRRLPGLPQRFMASDVDKLAREYTFPAKAT